MRKLTGEQRKNLLKALRAIGLPGVVQLRWYPSRLRFFDPFESLPYRVMEKLVRADTGLSLAQIRQVQRMWMLHREEVNERTTAWVHQTRTRQRRKIAEKRDKARGERGGSESVSGRESAANSTTDRTASPREVDS